MPSQSPPPDEYPSLLWITIPPVVLISVFWIRKWYLARQLRLYGIGKGAKGFQTNVRQVRITPEIRARIERGENVSAEEIAAAAEKAAKEPKQSMPAMPFRDIVEVNESQGTGGYSSLKDTKPSTTTTNVDNEWLPDSISQPKKRTKGKKK
ncbi:hypothetical protein DL96DRAFT_175935 [Flagelloscypha sp. PMI_526]|nr:hypothetical protein DL96DRAFT_175935 [Flagelloscypha sp. PMI_526]